MVHGLIKKLFATKVGLLVSLIITTLIVGAMAYVSTNGYEQNIVPQYARHGLSARVIWIEQSFNERFFGNGIMQQRREITADGVVPDNSRTLENGRHLGSWVNYSSVNQQGSYSYQTKYGHSVSVSGKARAKWLELEVRYTFNYEQVYTYSTTITIPPQKRTSVSQYDVRVKLQRINVKVQKQTAKLFGGWNNNNYWWEDEIVREYSGFEFKINDYNA